ncbi:ATP synthase F1 subunit delta [Egibacter rhizosphaerae]|uniref:ATP synthase subunit delta n=1 Tax=Egibacter rhizosphaerae TaxID=1670831 RepID=A0A411YD46_9ACTN|nr:ATP synthase F1 subunit delta [Egibacter rhizosphaerae]QBI19118.1 ATP synthase F1 subunit delta [Egibacter rhizosphaerae]
MAARDTVSGYARALVAAAQAEGELERVADELFRFARTVQQSPELADALMNPGVGVGERLASVERLLEGRAHPVTVGCVLLVVQSGHARELAAVSEEAARLAAEESNRELAEVRTATELSADQRERLTNALERATGKTVDLKVIVDPEVVGGLVARVGDTVIDGTVAKRLADVRTRVTG